MPRITTTVHDPIALAATCQRLGLPAPHEGSVQIEDREVFGWIVRLTGLYSPLVFDTLTGLVYYHARDNAFTPYARIMRAILRYYDIRAALQRSDSRVVRRMNVRRHRRPLPQEVA